MGFPLDGNKTDERIPAGLVGRSAGWQELRGCVYSEGALHMHCAMQSMYRTWRLGTTDDRAKRDINRKPG
jgi:hypothetical protein